MKGKEIGGADSTMNVNQSGGVGLADGDITDSMSVTGKIGQKPEFDRTRQKKK